MQVCVYVSMQGEPRRGNMYKEYMLRSDCRLKALAKEFSFYSAHHENYQMFPYEIDIEFCFKRIDVTVLLVARVSRKRGCSKRHQPGDHYSKLYKRLCCLNQREGGRK